MITTPDEWAALTDKQRFALLTDTQIDRNNLREFIHQQSGAAAAERQDAVVADLGKSSPLKPCKSPLP